LLWQYSFWGFHLQSPSVSHAKVIPESELNEALEGLKESGEYFRLSRVLFEGLKQEASLKPFYLFAAFFLVIWVLLLGLVISKGQRSIQGKLTLAFLGMSMIPLLIIGVLTYFNERGIIKNKVGTQLAPTADLKAMRLNYLLEEAISTCQLIANDSVLVDSLASIMQSPAENGSYLSKRSESNEAGRLRNYLQWLVKGRGYEEAFILNKNGIVVLSTYSFYEGINMTRNPHFRGAMRTLPGEVYIKDLCYSERTNTLCVAFSTKIIKETPDWPQSMNPLGVIVLRFAVDKTIYPLINRQLARYESFR
jgi:hypothetical protein